MAKRLRLRLSRVLSSFNTCRSKDKVPVTTVSHGPHVVHSVGPCCRPSLYRPPPPKETWREEEKWHVVASATGDGGDRPSSPRRKIDSDDGSGMFPPLVMRRREAQLLRTRRREVVATRRRRAWPSRAPQGSNSSADEDSGWFSSDEDQDKYLGSRNHYCSEKVETETLISTTDVDSSDHVPRHRTKRSIGGGGKRRNWPSSERAAMVRRLMPCAAATVRESFAVVKRSEDPRMDFRQSMAEMVLEKEIFEPRALEQLLHCFLSLNSHKHHAAIVAAFEDIWNAIFPAEAAGFPC